MLDKGRGELEKAPKKQPNERLRGEEDYARFIDLTF